MTDNRRFVLVIPSDHLKVDRVYVHAYARKPSIYTEAASSIWRFPVTPEGAAEFVEIARKFCLQDLAQRLVDQHLPKETP